MIDDSGLPTPIDTGHRRLSTLDQLADIPEETIWLQKQKSARTRRAYRLDVQHFMRTLAITTPAELRQADHKAVIAWERYMREVERAASSTIRRRLAALSSLYKHLVRHDHAARNPVGEVERPAINRDEGSTARLRESAGAQTARPAGRGYDCRVARSRDPVGRLAGGIAPCRDRSTQGRRPAAEPRLRLVARLRKGGRRDALAINPQTAARLRAYLGGLGPRCRHRRAPVPAVEAQRQADATNAGIWTPMRSIASCANTRRARPRSRLLGALDARHLYHHGARKWRAARRRAESCRASRPEHDQAV